MSTENLKAEAESLGIKVDGRWSDERIQTEIDAALGDGAPEPETESDEEVAPAETASNEPDTAGDTPEPESKGESFTVKNVGTCNYRINNGRVPPGGKYTFNEQDMKSERLMRKTQHAIKNGLLKQV